MDIKNEEVNSTAGVVVEASESPSGFTSALEKAGEFYNFYEVLTVEFFF
jgi:hypothetical protein